MVYLLSSLILLATFSFNSSFYQHFYIPKLVIFYCIGIVCAVFFSMQRQLFLPSRKSLLFILVFIFIATFFGMWSVAPLTSFMHLLFYLGACLLYLTILNLNQAQQAFLLKIIFGVAVAQIALILPQFFDLNDILPASLIGQHERVFGTVGNQEFLSTLLGVSVFIGLHFHRQRENKKTKALLIASVCVLLVSLMLAQNKGALIFIALYFFWQRSKNYKLLLALGAVALLAAFFLFPTSIKGRLFLWLVALAMFKEHVLFGVGLRQFENNYLETVYGLFGNYPILSNEFGSYTSVVLDAHNIFLQFAVELGIVGLVLSILFALHVFRLSRANDNYLGAALLLLLFKSLYTVVFTSITSMIVFVTLLGIMTEKNRVSLTIETRKGLSVFLLMIVLAFPSVIYLSFSDFYYQRGIRRLFMGQHELAISQLSKAIYINPENDNAYSAMAHVNFLQGRHEEMRNFIDKTFIYRKNKNTYKIAAYMYYYAKLYDDAFDIYRFLHATFPEHLTSMAKLADIYMIRHDYDNAYLMANRLLSTTTRQHAESDSKNRSIARKIVNDSFPYLSH